MLVNEEVICDACNGTGKEKCRGCGGNGKIFIPITNENQTCPTCSNGFLKCSSCSGTGKKLISVEVADPTPQAPPQPANQSGCGCFGWIIMMIVIFLITHTRTHTHTLECGLWKYLCS